MPRHPTIRDVAKHAGVSKSTVSRVLSARDRPVSDGAKRRVLAAVEALGYEPNPLARGLRRGETRTLGLVVRSTANPFFAEVARGAEDAALAQGYSLLICNTDGDPARERSYIDVLLRKQIDGIFFLTARTRDDQMRSILRQGIAVVTTARPSPDLATDCVWTDNVAGGRAATSHLVSLGHRRIACIAGARDLSLSEDRLAGYRAALAEARMPVEERYVVLGDFRPEGGYQAARRLLALDPRPTALFACNDLMAIGAICAATEIGLAVPQDLSVVGFDNLELAAFGNPPLTTIAQPTHEIGRIAAAMLIDRLQEPALPLQIRMMETELVVRRSTAPPGEDSAFR
ncbi:MAG: LacI family DNA-binding transcriptional regulator [Anaerolineae bacterium]|nr:LacI family DNA-binding transcriptional regulator [Anaerolineae bacterium]